MNDVVNAITDIFTAEEIIDIIEAADERGIFPGQLVHEAVINDLAR